MIAGREGGRARLSKTKRSIDVADLQKMAKEELVIQMVNLIINQAIQDRACDIHIEPFDKELRVRYRVDGVLHEVSSPPKRFHAAVVSRIKILADMNIAERRLPQDGRMRIKSSGRQIDLRVSTLPTIYGEGVVMRILDKQTAMLGLDGTGHGAGHVRHLPPPDSGAARHHSGHRADGFRQNHHAVRQPERNLQRGKEDHHG